MSENSSPSKQSRAFHPYGRVRSSPVKPLGITSQKCVTLSALNDVNVNYFSFSGGSSSLFPTTQARPPMGELSNIQKPPLGTAAVTKRKIQPPIGTIPKELSNLQKQPLGTVAVTTKKIQPPIGTIPTKTVVAKEKPAEAVPVRVGDVGVIGSRRPLPLATAKPNITGFIPLDKSFKIWGDSSSTSNSNSCDVPEGDENKNVSTNQLPRTKSFREGLQLLGATLQTATIQAPATPAPRGILTERRVEMYDVPEYTMDIYKYWLSHEKRVRMKLRPKYMDLQPDISHKMRSILIDWLVEVGMEYNFHEETLFLAVNCIDRFLSKMSVTRNKLQLLGTTALFVAAKYEELQPPEVGDVVFITDETYTKREILDMESIMLTGLGFELMIPTAYDFVRGLCAVLSLDSPTTSLATYLCELSLLDGERYFRFLPSVIAISAICLARYARQKCFWDSQIDAFTPHPLREIQKCVENLFFSFYDAPTSDQNVIYDKYKSVRFCCASQAPMPATLPWRYK